MWLSLQVKMFLWLFFLGQILTEPVPSKSMELSGLLNEGELFKNSEQFIKFIIPGIVGPSKSSGQGKVKIDDLLNQEDGHFINFKKHHEAGHTMKGLTFNIYDDNLREATIALFRIFESLDDEKLYLLRDWVKENVNKDMFDYAWRLASIYRHEANLKELDPPFIQKPNYFVNSEVIIKALQYKSQNQINDIQVAKQNQIYPENDVVVINANYSSWNLVAEGCEENVDYFMEDIGLNSYYYGVHLQYPFWMSNNELSGKDSRYAEKNYYIHQQLLARYQLEKLHYQMRNVTDDSNCFRDFNPYLLHDNGLSFPTRCSVLSRWSDDQARLKEKDLAIRECMSRRVMYMDNGTKITLTEDNYIDLLSKLIKANLDSVETSKIVKSLFGYGSNNYPVDRYNPAPTVLHNPQTMLRDPIYWQLIKTLMKYFNEFSSSLKPFDFSKYVTDDFKIIESSFSKITTYFDYYQLSLTKFLYNENLSKKPPTLFTARLRRLKHLPFTFNFTIESYVNSNGIIKIFIGPECEQRECWEHYSKFYELDSFVNKFQIGLNHISWSPETSERYSYDDYYNLEKSFPKKNKFDFLKFPENLIIPKGLEEGLNLTIFAIVLTDSNSTDLDSLPLGFPFHRQAVYDQQIKQSNYLFDTITINHKKNTNDNIKGYFSPHLN